MVGGPNTSDGKPYDPYAPEIVRKMAIVALVCALAGFAAAAFFGISGFLSYEDYTEKIRHGEAIYAPWLYDWLLRAFGPAGALVFDELFAVIFLGLTVFAGRGWWTMRTGHYDPEQDKASPGLLLTMALVAAISLLAFFAVVRLVVAFR